MMFEIKWEEGLSKSLSLAALFGLSWRPEWDCWLLEQCGLAPLLSKPLAVLPPSHTRARTSHEISCAMLFTVV